MKKILILVLTLLLQTNAYAAEKLVVLLDWFANPSHAPLFVAQQQGFFKAAGLDVELIGPSDPSDPPKLVAANKADIAITYEPQLIEQISRGLPLLRIGTLMDKPLNCLTVLKDSDIHSIKQLAGKRIGHSNGGMSSVMLKTMLEKNGLQLKEVELINVHYDLTQALLAKKVAAVTGMMRTFEVIQMELAGHPARIFLPEENGVPTYNELVLVINKDHRNDPRLRGFLTALQKGVTYLQQHPEETWQAFAKTHPALNDQLNHRAWMASLPYFAKIPAKFNAGEWQQFIQFMLKNQLIEKAYPVSNYAIELKIEA